VHDVRPSQVDRASIPPPKALAAPDCGRDKAVGKKRNTLTSEIDGVSYEFGPALESRSGV
jgi:hypothetical protein